MPTKPQAPDAHLPEYLTVPQAAALLNVSVRTVWRMLATADLPAHRFGARSVRINRADLSAWADGQRRDHG